MNRRTLKKHCKRAIDILVSQYGYSYENFHRADGYESVYAPAGMERRYQRNGFLEPGPLKGTWLYWSSDYFGEGDYDLPSEILRTARMWDKMTDADIEAMLNTDPAP